MSPTPPRPVTFVLERVLRAGPRRDAILGDLHEHYVQDRARGLGRRRAGLRYLRRALEVAWASTRQGGTGWASQGIRDARHALRGYRRAPAFFAVAMLTLALGVGANSAVFSVVRGVYLRPLDFDEPDRLLRIGLVSRGGDGALGVHTAGLFTHWREGAATLDGMAAHAYRSATARRGDEATRVLTTPVIGDLFGLLGVEAALGRTLGGPLEAVVAHDFWTGALGSDRSILGARLDIDGRPHVVVGVMPPRFTYPDPSVDVWVTADVDAAGLRAHDDFYLRTVGRLAPGRTREQALAELTRLTDEVARERPEVYRRATAGAVPLQDFLQGDDDTLWTLASLAVAVVLVLACLNLGTLLLARSIRRRGELSVRRALGATRGDLLRQLLVETLVLASLGGAVGLVFGWSFLQGILRWLPGGIARIEAIRIDATVVAFTFGVSLAASLLIALVPALRARREGPERAPGRKGGGRPLGALVAVEVGLAVVLLGMGVLTGRSFWTLLSEDPGVDLDGRMVLSVTPTADGPGALHAFYEELEARLAAVPGVRSVGAASSFPVAGFTPGAWVNVAGRTPGSDEERPGARYQVVTPGYFETLGIELLEGRLLTRADGVDGTPSVVVSRAAARTLFPGEGALGRRFDLGLDGSVAPLSTVVGVVSDVRLRGLEEPAPPAVWLVQELNPGWTFGFEVFVHAPGADESLAAAVRAAVREVDPGADFLGLRDAGATLSGALGARRNTMYLFALLGALALVLASVGIAGVLLFAVGRRTREIGIRLALGADRGAIRARIVRDGLAPVLVGAAVGVAATLALGRVAGSLLFGVTASDPATLAIVVGVFLAVATPVLYLPARRATRVDPVRALQAG